MIEVVLVYMMIFIATPGQKKYYVVKNVLEKFTSKVGQFVEVMDILRSLAHALFIDHEIQVAEKDEKIYSSNFFKSSYDLSKKIITSLS